MLLGGFLLDACVIADAADGGSRCAGSKVDRQLPCICRIHIQRRIRTVREHGTPDKNTPAAVVHVLVGILADAGILIVPEIPDLVPTVVPVRPSPVIAFPTGVWEVIGRLTVI